MAINEDIYEKIPKLTMIDYGVFILMLVISACIGIYYAIVDWKSTKVSNILVGNRSMNPLPVSMSVLATFMSAITLLGTPSEMYNFGTQYFIIVVSYFLVIPASIYIYLPIFYNLGVTSAYEYFELRFNRIVRNIASIIFAIQTIIYISVVLYAPSLAISQVTGLDLWFCIASTGIVCSFYTAIGGIKAVVLTDVFQIVIMFSSVTYTTFKAASDLGGWSCIWEVNSKGQRLEFFNFDPDPRVRHTVWTLVVGGFFSWLSLYGVNQSMVQRYVSIRSLKEAQNALWINLPGLVLLITFCSLAGLVIFAKYHGCDPLSAKIITSSDQLFPLLVLDVLRFIPGLSGLFVSGIFSGALSSMSSGVNSLAAITLEDFVLQYIKPDISEKWKTRITKIIVLLYGFLCIALVALAQLLGNVLQTAFIIVGVFGGPLLGTFTLGMLFPWANAKGALSGMLTGLVVANWIGFGSVISRHSTPKAPMNTSECMDLYNVTVNVTTPNIRNGDEYSDIYKISYMYFCTIGTLTAFIVGAVVSLFSGYTNPEELNPKLIVPMYEKLRPCISESYWKKLKLDIGAKYKDNVKEENIEKSVTSSRVKSSENTIPSFQLNSTSLIENSLITNKNGTINRAFSSEIDNVTKF